MNCASSRFRVVICSLISGVGMILSSQRASALVIDDFTQGGFAMLQGTNFAGSTLLQTGLNPAATLGGTRSVYVGPLGALPLASASIDPVKGRFHFTANTGLGYFKLDWGGVTPLNVNLTGNNRFQIEFVDTTPNVAFDLFNLRVKSANSWFSYEIGSDLASALNGNSFGTLSIPFSKFAGANFAEVQAIELDAARVPQNFHLVIDSFTAVPEPAVAALLVIASVLVGFTRSGRTITPDPVKAQG
jgi:hypothetical protein